MTHKKYEIRDREVQEIMQKQPNVFISRGNFIVFFILFAAFYFLNRFPLYEKEITHFEITSVEDENNQADSIRIGIKLNDGISKNVKRRDEAKLFVDGAYVNGELDSIGYTLYNAPVLYFKIRRIGLIFQKGMIGRVEIVVREKTFLSMLIERLGM